MSRELRATTFVAWLGFVFGTLAFSGFLFMWLAGINGMHDLAVEMRRQNDSREQANARVTSRNQPTKGP